MRQPPTILETIRNLSAALVAQDSATSATAAARREAIRQAIRDGHTRQAIAEATGISAQRIGQLANETERET